ncbi:MAG: Gfo/Idh/MocA family oxidoreductase, partial [Brachybacterium sp.]|nr:Gfo/Idh/MocA family oxidoreductase [Brachybacterium sp.]
MSRDDRDHQGDLTLPEHGVPDPRDAPALRWGVISPGHIGAQFTDTLHRATSSRVVAVASRSQDRAEQFARSREIDGAFDSVEKMLEAGGLDVVYIASPHAQHHAFARTVLEAGVPVLVEKAFTLNRPQASDLVDLARERSLFLMEAMWARFLPQYGVLRRLIEGGVLGEIVSVAADHGQAFPFDPEHRLYDPDLGGGALLDLGVYPISIAQAVLGDLTDCAVRGDLAPTGVDAHVALLAAGSRGGRALLETTLRARGANEATIVGTAGRVRLSGPFYAPGILEVDLTDGRTARFEHPADPEDGMAYEAAETARRITAGDLESPLMSWADTLSVMGTMDEVR